MNEYDSELVRSILAKEGYSFVKNELEADIIMLNTCAIRENAHRKVYGRVHEIHHKRRSRIEERGGRGEKACPSSIIHPPSSQENHRPIIGILGCMATNLRTELFENRGLKIDFIAGPDSYKRLPDLIREAMETADRGERRENGQGTSILNPRSSIRHHKPFDVTLSEFETYSDVYPHREKGVNAWLAVMRGCNNFCTFCVVPYTRGRERSRSVDNVLDEVKRLADEGFKQVTLLGQNVNSYRHETADFADLLNAVSKVNGIERIRFTSPHPKDFPEDLLKTIAGNPKVCKHIHLPAQSGNNRILELMDRTYTREEFLALVDKSRKLIPGLVLTTDIIVGFCTETDAEFEETFKLMKQVEFDSAFIFKYSERKNTIAARKYPDDIPDEKKTERIVRLNELQMGISFQKNQKCIGRTFDILLEQEGDSPAGKDFRGRTDGNKLVIIPAGPYTKGQTIKIRVTGATPHALKGEVLD